VGLIVNPVAGLGGSVGLKGSDGVSIQRRAIALGATSQSTLRAIDALMRLKPLQDELTLVTCPGEMGETAAIAACLPYTTIALKGGPNTTAEDTTIAARSARQLGVELLLFAGGDGTARDVLDAIDEDVPVVGIPAGVKMQSAVFAVNPVAAGNLAVSFLRGQVSELRDAEVMDVDESALRRGRVAPKLYGYLRVPHERRLIQGAKVASGETERAAMAGIARAMAHRMKGDLLYIVGPGTTTREVLLAMGLKKTLVGVDAVWNGALLAVDANERQLLELLKGRAGRIIVTPIGGQGYLFGRGNQQISPQVIRQVGTENIFAIATPAKLNSLRGRPLLVDTGDDEMDRSLSGHIRVVCGVGDDRVLRVSCQG
jgi:predicted polyphosphate/ATP-dependent NAD kinase